MNRTSKLTNRTDWLRPKRASLSVCAASGEDRNLISCQTLIFNFESKLSLKAETLLMFTSKSVYSSLKTALNRRLLEKQHKITYNVSSNVFMVDILFTGSIGQPILTP